MNNIVISLMATKVHYAYHLSNRHINKVLSTEAHARRTSGKIPHKAVPSSPDALYFPTSAEGNSQVSTTSIKGGHCNSKMQPELLPSH